MKKILIDTNALMAMAELKIDLFTELDNCCDFKYQLWVLEGSIIELKRIVERQRGKYRAGAKLALSLLKAKNVKVLKSKGKVDDLLAAYSQKGYLVLTQDIRLKQRLTKPHLTIRQKRKVIIIN